ncbi:MAG TPA: hypothetical protein VHP36_03915 [Chitinispirillaceae bacterium]|nr:hypothetical protein [Chitinispirillaceae bacterium]
MANLIINKKRASGEPEIEISYEFDSENKAVLEEIMTLLPMRKNAGKWVDERIIELCERSMHHKKTSWVKMNTLNLKELIKNSFSKIKSRNSKYNSDTKHLKLHPC